MVSFSSLCLCGGGITGFVHIGVLDVLHRGGHLDLLDTIVATSAGCVVGFLYAVGMSPSDIFDALSALDDSLLKFSDTERFLDSFGVDSGEYFVAHLVDILLRRKISPLITFAECVRTFRKRLVFTGTNVDDRRVEYFSPEVHPDMKIMDALRISISIPLLFSAVVRDGKTYVDGALKDNYPIGRCLRDWKERHHNVDSSRADRHVVGSHIQAGSTTSSDSLENFLVNLFTCCIEKDTDAEAPCTIQTRLTENVSSLQFNATVEMRHELRLRGRQSARVYLSILRRNGIESGATTHRRHSL